MTVALPAGVPGDQSKLAVFDPVPMAVTFIGVPGVVQPEVPLVVKEYEVPYPELLLSQLVLAKTLK